MADILAEIKKIPPVTRFLVLSSLGVTAPAVLGLVPIHKLVFITELITRKWEVSVTLIFLIVTAQRLVALENLHKSVFRDDEAGIFVPPLDVIVAFFVAFTRAFSQRYPASRSSNSLEFQNYERRSSDYAWQLFLASLAIIALNRPFGTIVHDHAFVSCLTYLTCVLSPPGAQTSVMGLITIPAKYFPYALLAIDAINGRAVENLTGMIAGHLWWWFVWGAGTGAGGMDEGRFTHFVLAPRWLRDWFGEREGERRTTNRGGYQVHAPRRPAQAAGARSTGYNWGSGQRLGSD